MNKMIFFWMLMLGSSALAQDDVFSFYFHEDAVMNLDATEQIDPKYYTSYELDDLPQNEVRRAAGEFLIVDETGIYLEKNRLLTISREEVRENPKYNVYKGWLHGVIENDSVPCALDGEMYYFLVPVKTYLYAIGGGPDRMVQINRSAYGIFSLADNGNYSGIVFIFDKSGVDLFEIDFSKKDPNNIDNIEKKEMIDDDNGITTYILNPLKHEWDNYIFKSCIEVYDSYSMVIINE